MSEPPKRPVDYSFKNFLKENGTVVDADKFLKSPMLHLSETEKQQAMITTARIGMEQGWSHEEIKEMLEALGLVEYPSGPLSGRRR